MLDKLKTSPDKKKLTLITIVALAAFVTLTIVFRFYEDALKATGYGIIEFEFAFSQTTAQTILGAWAGLGLLPLAIESVFLDFIYIAAYGIGLFCLTILIVRALEERWQNIGIIFSFFPLIAGVFDIIENVCLIEMLSNPASFAAAVPTVATIFAGLKFGLLIGSLGFIAAGGIVLLIKKFKGSGSTTPK